MLGMLHGEQAKCFSYLGFLGCCEAVFFGEFGGALCGERCAGRGCAPLGRLLCNQRPITDTALRVDLPSCAPGNGAHRTTIPKS